MQLGPPSCIQNRVLRSFSFILFKAFEVSFRFTGFVMIRRVKVISQSVHSRDMYNQRNKIGWHVLNWQV